jgi:threonylcarbamoyladenosine tRNA methylthiotransferase MtaB
MPTFAIYTLGCRLNQADTALLADALQKHGFSPLSWGNAADLLIINSCAVTGVSSRKNRQAVHAARRLAPDAFIVLMGCDATAESSYWAENPDVDLVIPNPKPDSLPDLLPSPLRRNSSPMLVKTPPLPDSFTVSGTGFYPERTRANLKIQEGCDFHCSYCIVPHTRGPARSRRLDDILREAEALLERGHKEIVLSGVNIATYQDSSYDLPMLVERLLSLDDHFRIRLGSTEPGRCLDRLVAVMAAYPQRICRFLHLPAQYGEDSILRRMKRHYDCRTYEQAVLNAHERIPGLCLGTDIIVGFPGESEENFQACRNFIERIPFGLLHVFPYSPRPGTPAASMDERPSSADTRRRSAELRELAAQKYAAFANSQLGQALPVLIETLSPSPQGWSDNYLKVRISSKLPLSANTIVFPTITACKANRIVHATL